MTALAIALASGRRVARDRIALFFLIVLPVVVIVVVGSVVGGFTTFRVGVVNDDAGALSGQLVTHLTESHALAVHHFTSLDSGRTALRRGEIFALVHIGAGTDARLRAGQSASIVVFGEQTNSQQQAAGAAVAAVVADEGGRVQAARFAVASAGGSIESRLTLVDKVAAKEPAVDAVARSVDSTSRFLPSGFNYSAPTMLVLFVFINALAAGAAMTETRKLGMYERMSAAPVRPRQIVFGEALVYFAIAMAQSILIIAVGALGFGVHWGNAPAAAALVTVWALVGTGAGMLAGTVFKTPEQASSIAPTFGIVLGMLGGCMWPLEIVGATMKTVGHLTPHAWAIDAWTELLSRSGGVADIARPLLILAAVAAALITIASARLRRVLVA